MRHYAYIKSVPPQRPSMPDQILAYISSAKIIGIETVEIDTPDQLRQFLTENKVDKVQTWGWWGFPQRGTLITDPRLNKLIDKLFKIKCAWMEGEAQS